MVARLAVNEKVLRSNRRGRAVKKYDRYTRSRRQEYMNSYYVKRLNRAIDLLGGECSECGSVEYLEFAHKEPRVLGSDWPVTKLLMRGWGKVLTELNKCRLLCYPCHLESTAKDFRAGKFKYRKHGRLAESGLTR